MKTRDRLVRYARRIGSQAQTVAGQWRAVHQYLAQSGRLPRNPATHRVYNLGCARYERFAGHMIATALSAGVCTREQISDPLVPFLGAAIRAGIAPTEAAQTARLAIRYMWCAQHRYRKTYNIKDLVLCQAEPSTYRNPYLTYIDYDRFVHVVRACPREIRAPGGGVYLAATGETVHGYTAYQASWRCGDVGRYHPVASSSGYYVVGRGYGYHSERTDVREAIREAIHAERLRWATDDASPHRAQLIAWAHTIWVTPEDSVNAGHCSMGTRSAQDVIQRRISDGYPIGAIRGDLLLALRGANDSYALRALSVAAHRQRHNRMVSA